MIFQPTIAQDPTPKTPNSLAQAPIAAAPAAAAVKSLPSYAVGAYISLLYLNHLLTYPKFLIYPFTQTIYIVKWNTNSMITRS